MLYKILQPVDAMQVTTQLPFCDETAVHKFYILQTPPPCIKPESLVTHKRHAKIYNPSKKLTKIKTYSCKIQRTSYTSTFYFFGTKQHETTVTNDPSPSVELCQDWVTHKHSVTMGTFKQITKMFGVPQMPYIYNINGRPLLLVSF